MEYLPVIYFMIYVLGMDKQPQCHLTTNEDITQNFINYLNVKLPIFLQHAFVKWKQLQESKAKWDGLYSEQLILQIDFAENFSCKLKKKKNAKSRQLIGIMDK